jgi:hypothetical protein
LRLLYKITDILWNLEQWNLEQSKTLPDVSSIVTSATSLTSRHVWCAFCILNFLSFRVWPRHAPLTPRSDGIVCMWSNTPLSGVVNNAPKLGSFFLLPGSIYHCAGFEDAASRKSDHLLKRSSETRVQEMPRHRTQNETHGRCPCLIGAPFIYHYSC